MVVKGKTYLTNGLGQWITMVKVAKVDSPCVLVQQ
jgi:hypothetical protein